MTSRSSSPPSADARPAGEAASPTLEVARCAEAGRSAPRGVSVVLRWATGHETRELTLSPGESSRLQVPNVQDTLTAECYATGTDAAAVVSFDPASPPSLALRGSTVVVVR